MFAWNRVLGSSFRSPVWRLPSLFFVLLALSPAAGLSQDLEDPCVTGEELFRAGKFEEARTELRRCLDAGGETVETLLPLTVMAVQTGRREVAMSYSGRAVAIAPDDAEARYWHGRALLDAGRIDEALELAEQAKLQLSGRNAWQFPDDTVLVKTFSLDMRVDGRPAPRRIETRFAGYTGNSSASHRTRPRAKKGECQRRYSHQTRRQF